MLLRARERDGARAWCACVCALWLAAAALCAPPPKSDKRQESEFMAPAPFVLGSRYGRSPPRLMAPRNDRFFVGSRYGKRASSDGFFIGSRYGKRSGPAHEPPAPPAPPAPALLCDYTGVFELYRCHPYTNDLHDERIMEDTLSLEDD